MPWVKITDGFPEDPKIEQLSHRAFRLYLTALCYCARNLTDGHLTPKAVKVAASSAGVPVKTADELIASDLWQMNGGGGYCVSNYLDYNPSAADVRGERDKAKQRMNDLRTARRSRNDRKTAEKTSKTSTELDPNQRPFATQNDTETGNGLFKRLGSSKRKPA